MKSRKELSFSHLVKGPKEKKEKVQELLNSKREETSSPMQRSNLVTEKEEIYSQRRKKSSHGEI